MFTKTNKNLSEANYDTKLVAGNPCSTEKSKITPCTKGTKLMDS